jgi:hypothetical protein
MMPRWHTLARAISKIDQRFLLCVGLPDAQEDGLRIAECQAIEFDVIERTGLFDSPTAWEPLKTNAYF